MLRVPLPRDRSAPARARDALARYLSQAAAADSVADAMLVASELVTNALVHGEGEILMRLAREGELLRGSVSDEGRGFDHVRPSHDTNATGGRGLTIVDALVDRWGVLAGSGHVWFEMDVGTPG